jgi:hypothetical protein
MAREIMLQIIALCRLVPLAAALLIGRSWAADLPGAWVELAADGKLEVRNITAAGAACPKVSADDSALISQVRSAPDQPDGAYPVQVCAASAPLTASKLSVDGLPAPTLPKVIRRIVVIGDTGCRLKGDYIQDCNDTAKWTFSTIARLAAARHPDLVVHVGDYHYRETPCPPGHPGCAGSPYGDNWAVWQRDFFNPAAPLLAAAPWVLARGNHELCDRGGHGWFRLLDPHPGAIACVAFTSPYALSLGGLHLLMLDSADADDTTVDPTSVALYRGQLQTLLADVPANAWLVTHRPVWALNQGEGVTPGETLNATLQAAIKGLVPATLDMVLSGHLHDFILHDFGPVRPQQLVVGDSGDTHATIMQPVVAGAEIAGVKLRHGFATEAYGYLMLQRIQQGWLGTVYSVTDQVLAHCRLQGRNGDCWAAGS